MSAEHLRLGLTLAHKCGHLDVKQAAELLLHWEAPMLVDAGENLSGAMGVDVEVRRLQVCESACAL